MSAFKKGNDDRVCRLGEKMKETPEPCIERAYLTRKKV